MVVLGDEKAAHVAQHHQDVLIDGVDVKQIVLHLPDDSPEDPEIAAEHRGLVHQPKRMRLPVRLAQDRHESRAIDRVAAKLGIHHVACVVKRAQRPGGQSAQTDSLLIDAKGLEDGVRIAPIEVVARHLEHAAAIEKLGRDRAHRGVLHAADSLFDVEHQDLVELRHAFRGPVVAPHQRFGRSLRSAHGCAEAFRDGGLQIENQPVFAAPGYFVKPDANQPQQPFVAMQLLDLETADQSLGRQLGPAVAEACSARHPDHHLQVAQAARAFLAVGLERIRRVFVLEMALTHLAGLRMKERLGIHRGSERVGVLRKRCRRSAQVARLEERRLHGDVAAALFEALFETAHARPDLEARVPARADEVLGGRVRVGGACDSGRRTVARPEQHQHVDVGVRIQLAATVAADRHQRRIGGHRGLRPEFDQCAVDEAGELPDQTCSRGCRPARRIETRQQRRFGATKTGSDFAGPDLRGARQPFVERHQPADGESGHRVRLRPSRRRPAPGGCRTTASAPRIRSRSRRPCAPTAPTATGPW